MLSNMAHYIEASDSERTIAAAVIKQRLPGFKSHEDLASFFGVPVTDLFQAQYRARNDNKKELCPTESIRKINRRAFS